MPVIENKPVRLKAIDSVFSLETESTLSFELDEQLDSESALLDGSVGALDSHDAADSRQGKHLDGTPVVGALPPHGSAQAVVVAEAPASHADPYSALYFQWPGEVPPDTVYEPFTGIPLINPKLPPAPEVVAVHERRAPRPADNAPPAHLTISHTHLSNPLLKEYDSGSPMGGKWLADVDNKGTGSMSPAPTPHARTGTSTAGSHGAVHSPIRLDTAGSKAVTFRDAFGEPLPDGPVIKHRAGLSKIAMENIGPSRWRCSAPRAPD
jgi:hypothetical protein